MSDGARKSLQKRLEALERRFGRVPIPETPEETARRDALIRAALDGREPVDLAPDEVERFAKIREFVPILRELVIEGILSADGSPGGSDPVDGLEDHDVHADGEHV